MVSRLPVVDEMEVEGEPIEMPPQNEVDEKAYEEAVHEAETVRLAILELRAQPMAPQLLQQRIRALIHNLRVMLQTLDLLQDEVDSLVDLVEANVSVLQMGRLGHL